MIRQLAMYIHPEEIHPVLQIKDLNETKKSLSIDKGFDIALGSREKELEDLKLFIIQNLTQTLPGNEKHKRSLYMFGPSGTGKTTCCQFIINATNGEISIPEDDSEMNAITSLKSLYLNCMTVKNIATIFKRIEEGIQSFIDAKNNKQLLLFIDEVDNLSCSKDEELYKLFELPYNNRFQIILIAIGNSPRFIETWLPFLEKNETMCPQRIIFKPYTRSQMINIIDSRFSISPIPSDIIIKSSAISFLTAKIATLSGDVRQALSAIGRGINERQLESRFNHKQASSIPFQPIDIPKIEKILKHINGTSLAAAFSLRMKNQELPLQQKIIVACLWLVVTRGDRPWMGKWVTFSKLHQTYVNVCNKLKMKPIDRSEGSTIMNLLDARGIVSTCKASSQSTSIAENKIRLAIGEDEIQ